MAPGRAASVTGHPVLVGSRAGRRGRSMAKHPFHEVAIVGVHNTEQARVLEGHDSRSITLEAGLGAIADAGLSPRDIDGVVGVTNSDFLYQSRIGPAWRSMS